MLSFPVRHQMRRRNVGYENRRQKTIPDPIHKIGDEHCVTVKLKAFMDNLSNRLD